MYNSDTPSRAELPSSRQLLRSTILAAISALVLLVAVVLPAEYGIDPTGVGRVLGMTKMGQTKQQLAAEAAADAATPTTQAPAATSPATAADKAAKPMAVPEGAVAATETAQAVASAIEWRDEMSVTLKPGEGTEIKMKLAAGGKAQYSWWVEGGTVNFDTHGDAPGKSISYEKGRGVPSDEGVLEAAFTGNHGWYWRNRGKSNVKVILRTRGEYTDIKKLL
jgi:membrane carboxypeptidase/penicillin-binding protein PbpC